MKRLYYLSVVAIVVALTFSACGSSKTTSQGDVEVEMPCHGTDFMTNKDYFRASAVGLASDMTMAKKKAMSEVRGSLAAAIGVTVKQAASDYAKAYQVAEEVADNRRFEDMTVTSVDQSLTGLRSICEKMMKTKDGKYRFYVCVELSAENVSNSIADGIKKDDKLRMDFDYEKFKKTFDEEMSKQGK